MVDDVVLGVVQAAHSTELEVVVVWEIGEMGVVFELVAAVEDVVEVVQTAHSMLELELVVWDTGETTVVELDTVDDVLGVVQAAHSTELELVVV